MHFTIHIISALLPPVAQVGHGHGIVACHLNPPIAEPGAEGLNGQHNSLELLAVDRPLGFMANEAPPCLLAALWNPHAPAIATGIGLDGHDLQWLPQRRPVDQLRVGRDPLEVLPWFQSCCPQPIT